LKQFKRIIQLTDAHLFTDVHGELLKVNTLDSFKAVVDLAKTEITADTLLILSGDLSQDESTGAYQHIIDVTQNLSCEVAYLPGNHDDPKLLDSVLSQSKLSGEKHFINKNWQFILLNSHWPRHVQGLLAEDQIVFLKQCLSKNKQPTLIFLHHHFLPVGCAWLDPQHVKNDAEFFAVIDQFAQVKGVISGHVHQDIEQQRNTVRFITTPATSIQFKPNSKSFALDQLMPGLRIIDLLPDGQFKTVVKRVKEDSQFIPDMKSKGY
jgi:Icc protein